jgi:hypothetical protein
MKMQSNTSKRLQRRTVNTRGDKALQAAARQEFLSISGQSIRA